MFSTNCDTHCVCFACDDKCNVQFVGNLHMLFCLSLPDHVVVCMVAVGFTYVKFMFIIIILGADSSAEHYQGDSNCTQGSKGYLWHEEGNSGRLVMLSSIGKIHEDHDMSRLVIHIATCPKALQGIKS